MAQEARSRQGQILDPVRVARPRRRPVRLVALERQHALLQHKLNGAFVRLLCSSAFTLGEEVERFEAEFADYCGVSHCVGVASGTAALTLTLAAYGIGEGDEVILPAHVPLECVLAISHVGATPVLCDVEERTGLIDPDAARAAVGPRTAAVLAVHLYGQACRMAALEGFAKPAGLLVLEDAAQAHGARYRGHRAGSLGAAATFSFEPAANLGGLGDGGAICTDDEVMAARLRRLRNLGRGPIGEQGASGYNERLDALQAAMLRVKLPMLDTWNAARQAHAASYRERLPSEVRVIEERPESPCVFRSFAVRVGHRDSVAAFLHEEGIEAVVVDRQAIQPDASWLKERPVDVPRARAWAAEELRLPMHPGLLAEEIERVVDAVRGATFAAAAA